MAKLVLLWLIMLKVSMMLFVSFDAQECHNLDIKNSVSEFQILEGCKVVKGFLIIVLIRKDVTAEDFDHLSFPELREITDFLIFYDVYKLTNITKLFPNLTVIRGRKLFLNYALAVSSMPDLELIEFKSLVAIQRGHVYVGNVPKLCSLEKINWDRLTLSPGQNHIIPSYESSQTCTIPECMGCESDYCWSNVVCQKFENANVVNLVKGSFNCHKECLGGCYNSSDTGCVVCRGINNHGSCVDKCPNKLYYSEQHQRCYTKAECYKERFYIIGDECKRKCPSGFTRNRKSGSCIKCASGCVNVCGPQNGIDYILISNLADADALKGCHRIKGSLLIQIQNKVDEKQLMVALESLQVVQGFIKVRNSPHLKSLRFLKNLEMVEGNPLENKTFAFILYKNDNLEELWSPQPEKKVEFAHGGIYSFSNNKLCNGVLRSFVQKTIHDKEKDLIQPNDQEVLCDPMRILLEVRHISQHSTTIFWPINQTFEHVEILFREAQYKHGEVTSELDDPVCKRVHWRRNLMYVKNIPHNNTHYFYTINDLLSYTRYELLLKTFQEKSDYSARSSIYEFITTVDLPKAPKIYTLSKSSENITISWTTKNNGKNVEYYLLETIEHKTDLSSLDMRNFCENPAVLPKSNVLKDYDYCLQQAEQTSNEEQFDLNVEDILPCSIHHKENCKKSSKSRVLFSSFKISPQNMNFTITGLKHFTTYSFYMYACNIIGCGTYNVFNDKTNYSVTADDIYNLKACKISEKNEYRIRFKEPQRPNGAIVSYTIHFQKNPLIDTSSVCMGQIHCITRKQHEVSAFEFITILNETYEEVSVRTTSLAGSNLSKWIPIKICALPYPTKKINTSGIVLICLALGLFICMIWLCGYRQWCRNINTNVFRRNVHRLTGAVRFDDNQALVSTYDTVLFRNTHDEM